MTTGWSIRKWEGTKSQTSETVRREQKRTPRSGAHRRQSELAARVIRNGWSTFESAPKLDEFEPGTERKLLGASITLPQRRGKPGGASILVPEGDWSALQQLREERDREL